MTGRQMKLGVFAMTPGHHPAAWRHPATRADLGANFQEFAKLAKTAERGKFDMFFIGDTVAVADTSEKTGARNSRSAFFEPFTSLSAIAAMTERIGLGGTASTTFNEPYNLARKFASLDLISAGRAGWNIVTSNLEEEAKNFGGSKHLEHDRRYERAEEFVDVVTGLWDSFAEDAFLYDKENGVYFKHDRMKILNHAGEHFTVRGPLNVRRSPQGHAVLIVAGSSGPGRELAARKGEVVFAMQSAKADAQAYYADMKGRLEKYGRRPDQMLIMPGILPIVGRTSAEAKEKFEELQQLIDLKTAIAQLSSWMGNFDLSVYSPDAPVPDVPETNGNQSRQKLLLDMARRENLTIADLARRVAGARGHWLVIGTASEIADQMQERLEENAADGFNILPATLPGGLDDFVDFVVPELQKRGIFRNQYEGTTLRQHLGLKAPAGDWG